MVTNAGGLVVDKYRRISYCFYIKTHRDTAWQTGLTVARLLSFFYRDAFRCPCIYFFKVRMSAVLRDPTNESITHGAFPPESAELTQNCWGSIRIPDICSEFRRV